MLDQPAGDAMRSILSPGPRALGQRNLHMLAAVGIGRARAQRTVTVPELPRSRVFWHRARPATATP